MDTTATLLLITARPGTPTFAMWAAAVAHRIDDDGIDAVHAEIDVLMALARHRGLAPVAVDVLADPSAPEPARCRAFSHVISALVAPVVATADRPVSRHRVA